jgi:uncharacterized phage protein (TIGR01671 family)
MREILFRGTAIAGTHTGKIVYGYLVLDFWHHGGCGILPIDKTQGGYIEVDPKTVGQYTGLTAKDVKIFEGDIGRYKQTDGAKENGNPIICTGVVLYNEKTASFAVESKDEKGRKYFDYFPIKDFEVIGNIHDNPELLKGGE